MGRSSLRVASLLWEYTRVLTFLRSIAHLRLLLPECLLARYAMALARPAMCIAVCTGRPVCGTVL